MQNWHAYSTKCSHCQYVVCVCEYSFSDITVYCPHLLHSLSTSSPLPCHMQGLAGSSAIITATLKCLMKFYNLTEAVSHYCHSNIRTLQSASKPLRHIPPSRVPQTCSLHLTSMLSYTPSSVLYDCKNLMVAIYKFDFT